MARPKSKQKVKTQKANYVATKTSCTTRQTTKVSFQKYCFCQQAESGFMIFCDTCNLWFHGKCVGETPRSCQNVENWFCFRCRFSQNCLKKEQELSNLISQLIDLISKGMGKSCCKISGLQDENGNLKKLLEDEKTALELTVKNFSVQIKSFSELQTLYEEKGKDHSIITQEVEKLSGRINELQEENCKLTKSLAECQKLHEESVLKCSSEHKFFSTKTDDEMSQDKGEMSQKLCEMAQENAKLREVIFSLRKMSRLSLSSSQGAREMKIVSS